MVNIFNGLVFFFSYVILDTKNITNLKYTKNITNLKYNNKTCWNLLKNNQFLAKISKISILTALKWKIYVLKTKLKKILNGFWTKKLNMSIGARPRAETFSLRRPARSSFYKKYILPKICNHYFKLNTNLKKKKYVQIWLSKMPGV
jgi:hypothetical protein